MAMRRNTSKSIYNQSEALIEITRKLNMCSGVVHSTPLLVKAQDQSEKLMMKDALLKPHLGGQSLDYKMANLIAGVSSAKAGISRMSSATARWFKIWSSIRF